MVSLIGLLVHEWATPATGSNKVAFSRKFFLSLAAFRPETGCKKKAMLLRFLSHIIIETQAESVDGKGCILRRSNLRRGGFGNRA